MRMTGLGLRFGYQVIGLCYVDICSPVCGSEAQDPPRRGGALIAVALLDSCAR